MAKTKQMLLLRQRSERIRQMIERGEEPVRVKVQRSLNNALRDVGTEGLREIARRLWIEVDTEMWCAYIEGLLNQGSKEMLYQVLAANGVPPIEFPIGGVVRTHPVFGRSDDCAPINAHLINLSDWRNLTSLEIFGNDFTIGNRVRQGFEFILPGSLERLKMEGLFAWDRYLPPISLKYLSLSGFIPSVSELTSLTELHLQSQEKVSFGGVYDMTPLTSLGRFSFHAPYFEVDMILLPTSLHHLESSDRSRDAFRVISNLDQLPALTFSKFHGEE